MPPRSRPPTELNAAAAAPLLQLAERLVGAERTLEAGRLVTAFGHGFMSKELTDAWVVPSMWHTATALACWSTR